MNVLQAVRWASVLIVVSGSLIAQTLSYSGTPALLSNVTISMHGVPNQPYILAASDSAGPTVVAPLGSFDIGFPPILIAGAIPGLPIVPSLDPSGNASVSFDIPFNTSLIGTSWWFQGVYFDPQSPYGLSKTNGTHFTIANPLLAPTIGGISPNTGPAAGGTSVAIFGTNFVSGGTTVTIGGAALGNLIVVTPQLITGTIPPGTAGTSVNVEVSTQVGGTSILANGWTYQGTLAPLITSVTPDHATISGGVPFTLTGQALGPGTTIYVNGTAAIGIAQSAGSYTGILPATANPGYASILAVAPTGVALFSNTFRYTAIYDLGTGADGIFAPTSNVTLDTTNNAGVFNFTSFIIPAGVTVKGQGPNPLIIKCTGTITIAGTLDVSGEDASVRTYNWTGVSINIPPASGGPGGFRGESAMLVPLQSDPQIPEFLQTAAEGPGATSVFSLSQSIIYSRANHTVVGSSSSSPLGAVYGSPTLVLLLGGSGGEACFGGPIGSFQPGGGGGGAVSLQADVVTITGGLSADGGDGMTFGGSPNFGGTGAGSGGAVRIMTYSPFVPPLGTITTRGGTQLLIQTTPNSPGRASPGRWAVYSWDGVVTYGTEGVIAAGAY